MGVLAVPFTGIGHREVAADVAAGPSVGEGVAAGAREHVVAALAVDPVRASVPAEAIAEGRAREVLDTAQAVDPVPARQAGGEVGADPVRGGGGGEGGEVAHATAAVEQIAAE